MIFEFIVLGLITGVITGITGASGVLIIVPILTTFLSMPLALVLGTSLFVDVLASLSVSITYAKNKNIDFKRVVWILVGSLVGAQVGSFFVIGISKMFITTVLALCIGFFGWTMWKTGSTKKQYKIINLPEKIILILQKPIFLIILGFLIGLTTGIFGAGGGLFIFIILYSVLQLPIKTAVGTSTFLMMITALSGVLGYLKFERLDIKIGLIIGLASFIGGAFSSWLANRVKDTILAKLIGIFFITLFLIMLVLKVIVPLLS